MNQVQLPTIGELFLIFHDKQQNEDLFFHKEISTLTRKGFQNDVNTMIHGLCSSRLIRFQHHFKNPPQKMDQMLSFEATSQTCQYYFDQIQDFEILSSGLFPVFNETTVNFLLISGVDFQNYNFQVLI